MLRTYRDRADHCLHYTGCEWGRPKYYNLMVDNAVLGDHGTAEMIYEMMKKIM